jgi:hypothetical protein
MRLLKIASIPLVALLVSGIAYAQVPTSQNEAKQASAGFSEDQQRLIEWRSQEQNRISRSVKRQQIETAKIEAANKARLAKIAAANERAKARKAAEAKARAKAKAATRVKSVSVQRGSAWVEQVRRCIIRYESGGNYRAQNPSSSASGAYQFLTSTWAGFGGYSAAKYAPPSVQDKKFYLLFDNGRGRSHWAAQAGRCW